LFALWSYPAQKIPEQLMPVQVPMPLETDHNPTLTTVAQGEPGQPSIRQFSASALNDQISDAVKALGDKTVMGLARVDLEGAHLVIVGKVPLKLPGEFNWTVYSDKPWEGSWDAGVGLRWSI
jgi:hypothetical protein